VFRGFEAAAQHQTFSARLRVPVVGRRAGHATPRLRQRDTSGTPCVQLQSVLNAAVRLIHRSHYTYTPTSPLAAVSGVH